MDTNRIAQSTETSSVEMADAFTCAILQGDKKGDRIAEFSSLDSSLMTLIRNLSETLLPVEPSTTFMESLKQQLALSQRPTQDQEPALKLVQGRWVRTIMSVFTIVGIASRIIGVVVLLAALLRRRRRQASPA